MHTCLLIKLFVLVLHPYYKLAYIEQMWGGEDEYQDDLAAGLPGARNWQAYANEIVEKAVSPQPIACHLCPTNVILIFCV